MKRMSVAERSSKGNEASDCHETNDTVDGLSTSDDVSPMLPSGPDAYRVSVLRWVDGRCLDGGVDGIGSTGTTGRPAASLCNVAGPPTVRIEPIGCSSC